MLLFYSHGKQYTNLKETPRKSVVGLTDRSDMSRRSVYLTTLFLGILRPPKRLTSTSCTSFASNWQPPLLNQRKEKRKYVARPGIKPRTTDLRVRCPADCATQPGPLNGENNDRGIASLFYIETKSNLLTNRGRENSWTRQKVH